MKTKIGMALAACAATAFMAGSASAGVTIQYFPYGMGAPVLPLVTNFSSDTTNAHPSVLPAGYSWSGQGFVRVGSAANQYVAPNVGGVVDTGKYLAVPAHGDEETLTISSGIRSLEFYAGSLDDYNEVVVNYVGGSVTYSGADLLAASGGAAVDHSGTSDLTNGMFDLTSSSPITSVEFIDTTTHPAFEIAAIYAAAIPEPAVWLLSILGVAMVGAAARRRTMKPAFAA